jgi:hypothetical protein
MPFIPMPFMFFNLLNNTKRLVLLMSLTVFLSCSNQIRVHTDFDRSVEIHRLNSYRWLKKEHLESSVNPLVYNELNDKRIQSAVNEQMKAKGYTQSDSLAKIIIHYHIVIKEGTVMRTEPLGYHAAFFGSIHTMEPYLYEEGTLIIDFMKADTNDLIWRGWADSILDEENLITEDLIDKAVTKIFQSFPESAQKEVTEL